ncbi:MAG: 4'-phosphopantetheinyl transferase superfamily protein [Myxococcaceae bacterium]|nr:4'-phosphopantetheinyl transferase superfamily protein [Myxococcaceae bacterium]MBH2006646.1 4'-phosphopantetheinyl transferase superfamily protein [Myxococcaceae bacterium]
MVRIYRIPIREKSDAQRAMRKILALELKIPLSSLDIRYGCWGKPLHEGIHFSLSHSYRMALFAVDDSQPVGIDLEWLRPMPNFQKLAQRFFWGPEKICCDEAEFFRIWTAKEALCKVNGEPILGSLKQPVSWSRVVPIHCAKGYVAHLAFQTQTRSLEPNHVFDFSIELAEFESCDRS